MGIMDAFKGADRIRQIALASLLDLFAVHRFILTLLYWKAPLAGGVERIRESLLKDGKIPSAVLDGISKEGHSFDLFDDKSPFLQDPTARAEKEKDKKSTGSFFAEFAASLKKGAHVHVTGYLRSREVEKPVDGKSEKSSATVKVMAWEVRAIRIAKLDRAAEVNPSTDIPADDPAF